MGKTIIEKILAVHSEKETVTPGEIIDVRIDVRLARDFGGVNVVKNLKDNNLAIEDNSKTFFTFWLILLKQSLPPIFFKR